MGDNVYKYIDMYIDVYDICSRILNINDIVCNDAYMNNDIRFPARLGLRRSR